MSFLRATFILASAIVLSSGTPSIAAQNKPVTKTQIEYPDSEDGLKKLFQDILEAAKTHNQILETQLIHSLILPKNSPWFKNVFGPVLGGAPSGEYQYGAADFEAQLRRILEADIQRNWTDVKVKKFMDPIPDQPPTQNIFNDMQPRQALYQVILTGNETPRLIIALVPNAPSFQSAGDPNGYFFFIDGGFRFVPSSTLLSLPNGRPATGQSIPPHPRILHQTFPVYPPEARKAHVQGVVHLHLTVDEKGRVKAVKVTDGDPRLIKAAEECVRQWTFHPAVIAGKPVESEVDAEVDFSLAQ